jgi:hypothetical protein
MRDDHGCLITSSLPLMLVPDGTTPLSDGITGHEVARQKHLGVFRQPGHPTCHRQRLCEQLVDLHSIRWQLTQEHMQVLLQMDWVNDEIFVVNFGHFLSASLLMDHWGQVGRTQKGVDTSVLRYDAQPSEARIQILQWQKFQVICSATRNDLGRNHRENLCTVNNQT